MKISQCHSTPWIFYQNPILFHYVARIHYFINWYYIHMWVFYAGVKRHQFPIDSRFVSFSWNIWCFSFCGKILLIRPAKTVSPFIKVNFQNSLRCADSENHVLINKLFEFFGDTLGTTYFSFGVSFQNVLDFSFHFQMWLKNGLISWTFNWFPKILYRCICVKKPT